MIKKLLKVLLIGGLFIPCFSFAGRQEFDLGYTEEITSNTNLGYTLSVLPNANFLLNDEYRIIQIQGNGSFPTVRTYFWNWNGTTGGMYVMTKCLNGTQECNGRILGQGYFNFVNIVDLNYINDSITSVVPGFTPFSDILENSLYFSPDKLLIGGYEGMQTASLCFGYSDINKAVCFSFDRVDFNNCGGQPQYCTDGQLSYITNSQGYTSQDLEYLSSFATLSPFVGSSDKPSYEIGEDKYTYGQIVEGYEACGLDVGYCYGGFPHDDIFEPNQSIEDFTGYKFGYGANIRYLYSLYSDTYTPKEFFQQMLQAYNNGQINRFKTEPKALIMFVQQYVSGKSRGLLNVGFYDLWDYCNIKLGYNDLSSEYTGHNQTPVACYKNKITNEIPQGGFKFTGDNAYTSIVGTGGSGYSNASEFFGNISSMFQNGIGTVNTNYSGIIPAYILLFMFALILLRIIQH